MRSKKDIRLYNVMFPIWFLFFFPQMWLIVLPVNFLVDSLVLYLSARRQGVEEVIPLWKQYILPVWGVGFAADLLGAGLIFAIYMAVAEIPGFNPILFPGTTLISIPGVILAGLAIYFINKKLTFRRSFLDPALIHRLCLHLAIVTAPYTMLIPLYG